MVGAITLGRKSLWFDEAFDAVRIKGTWGSLVHLVGATEMSQGVYLIGLKPWAELTSFSEVWLRLPSVVAAALAAAFLVPLGTRLFDRTTGVVAGVLLATNEFLVRWSQQARTYALVTLAVVVVSILFVRALDDPRRRNWLLYAVAAAFAVYCHFYAGFVIVAHLASLPLAPHRPPLRRVVEAAVTFLVLMGPVATFTMTASRTQLSFIPVPSFDLVQEVVTQTTGRNAALALAAGAGLVMLAYRAGAGAATDRWLLTLVGGWAALPIALGLLVSTAHPILLSRYAIVIAPALALAGAVAIAALAQARRELAVGALALLIAISGYRIVEWYRSVPEDWRGAVAFIAGERGPSDAVVVTPSWALAAYRYYDPITAVEESAAGRRAFVVVRTGSTHGTADDSEVANAVVDLTGMTLVREHRFGRRVRVFEYEPSG